MRVAIIGSGIAGLGAAYALKDIADVTVFEKENRFGGHAHTNHVEIDGTRIAVDTGFIVYNYRNYPNLTGLFEHLDVPTKWSDMSFGLSVKGGRMEYACDSLNQIFAQRLNAFNPFFINGLREILKFNRIAGDLLDRGELEGLSLGAFLEKYRFSKWFRDCFVTPFGGAIWSTPVGKVLDFPAANFVSFFRNHDLMQGMNPMQRWRTVDGGSEQYVNRIVQSLTAAHSGQTVRSVTRSGGLPKVTLEDGTEAVFDQVVFACHGPQAASLLDGQDAQERAILSTFRTTANTAYLHSDPGLMPKRRRVWSSWNFLSSGFDADHDRPAPVTYWMQRLQGLDPAHDLFVSLNPGTAPAEERTYAVHNYAHPLYDAATFQAQEDIEAIQRRGGVWYAGAWLGYGFHEDGLRSGLRVAGALGAAPDWARDMPRPAPNRFAEAAE